MAETTNRCHSVVQRWAGDNGVEVMAFSCMSGMSEAVFFWRLNNTAAEVSWLTLVML